MKYKKGDRVRVKTLDKLKKEFGVNSRGQVVTNPVVNKSMQSKCGTVVTIGFVGWKSYGIKEDDWIWTDDMFEGLEQETVSELDIYKKAIELICEDYVNGDVSTAIKDYLTKAKQELQPILDKEEKEYLSAVIRPFKKRVEFLSKKPHYDNPNVCYILIELKDDCIILPDFRENTMYKGMEDYKEYTLKELGLEE